MASSLVMDAFPVPEPTHPHHCNFQEHLKHKHVFVVRLQAFAGSTFDTMSRQPLYDYYYYIVPVDNCALHRDITGSITLVVRSEDAVTLLGSLTTIAGAPITHFLLSVPSSLSPSPPIVTLSPITPHTPYLVLSSTIDSNNQTAFPATTSYDV